MEQVIASGCAAVLVAAGAGKLAAATDAAVALSTFGLGGRLARPAVRLLAGWELALAAGLLGGLRPAAWAAAGTFAAFAAAQSLALVAGHAGAPCGCLGRRGRLSPGGAARTGAGAVAASMAAGAGTVPPALAGGALAAGVLGALWGVARRPAGALEVASEGPAVGAPTALSHWLPEPGGCVRLAVFTSAGCRLCRGLGPALAGLAREGDVVLRTYEAEREHEVWAAVGVPGAPFAIAVGTDGRVLAKGTVNSERQLRSVLAAARDRAAAPRDHATAPRDHAAAASRDDLTWQGNANSSLDGREASLGGREGDSRRAFLARAATAAGAVTVAPQVAALVAPGAAAAFHMCGHIYTTDSCPHPTGLPRIDSRGRPLRAADGAPVDDLGRPIDGDGLPVDDRGRRLVDPDGRALPAAPRTPICEAVARRFRLPMRVDGSWYRCCSGRVRKLTDCCSDSSRRINGDRALTGYCHSGRTVFCVMYYDTRVPC